MLHYDRTDIREGIDLARSSSKEFMIGNYWFKFEDFVCNGCHVLQC